jgi:hypothetical protein
MNSSADSQTQGAAAGRRTPRVAVVTTVLLILSAIFPLVEGTPAGAASSLLLATWPGTIWLNHHLDRRRARLGLASLPAGPRPYDARSATIGVAASIAFAVIMAFLLSDPRYLAGSPWRLAIIIGFTGIGLTAAAAHLYAGRRLAAGRSVGRWNGLMRPILLLVLAIPAAVFGILALLQVLAALFSAR